MDIHKPKPWHGLRDFLKEYLIIVVGVLTALAGEQIASALHERHQAAQARENVRGELAGDMASIGRRTIVEPCVGRRLDEIAALLRPGSRPVSPSSTWIGRPQFWPIFEQKWLTATSAGGASLLSPKEQAAYGQLYYTLGLLQGAENQEQVAWAHLRTLETAQPLSPELAAQVQIALTEARLNDWQVRLFIMRSTGLAHGLKIATVKAQHLGSPSICLPIDTPRGQAQANVYVASGERLAEP